VSRSELVLQLPYLQLAACRWGSAGGERVLALHGWLDNAASFAALAPLLDACEVVALDLPGHGRSDYRAAGNWYHYVDYLGEVLAAADALGWPQFTLLGHSLGAAIASVVAATAPQRVRQLWLIEGLGPLATAAEKSLAVLQQAHRDRAAIGNKALRVFPEIDSAISARRQANGLSHPAARALVERGTRAVDGGWVWSSDPRLTLTSAIRLTEDQILAYLGGIQCPTLLVVADPAPPYFTEQTRARRCAAVAQLQQVQIKGTHHLHLEDPQPVADAIAAFRARHPRED
jgi:pimeloyl-ACP methyl ester carboxylesterase